MQNHPAPHGSQPGTLKARIAILLPDLRPGGAERLHVTLANAWRARGMKVEFLLRRKRGELLSELSPGIEIVDLKAKRVRDTLIPLHNYLRKSPPDALLAAMWPLTVLAPLAARTARFQGCLAVSEHSVLSRSYEHKGGLHRLILKKTSRWGYRHADARIAVSSGVADEMAHLSGLPRTAFTVIHNPAASGRDASAEARRLDVPGIPEKMVLAVGTLKRVKRFDLLIRAFSRVAHRLPGANLYILGEGSERQRLEDLVLECGLAGRVFLPGFTSDTASWYARADLFVLSSDHEGFGNVLVEAMEQGTPIVSTDCPVGPREILADGLYGKLVPPNDEAALAEAVISAIQAPFASQILRQRAKDFSVDTIADRYLESLLQSGKGKVAQ